MHAKQQTQKTVNLHTQRQHELGTTYCQVLRSLHRYQQLGALTKQGSFGYLHGMALYDLAALNCQNFVFPECAGQFCIHLRQISLWEEKFQLRKCATRLDCDKACHACFKFLIAMERPNPRQVVLGAMKTWLNNFGKRGNKHHLSLASVSVSAAQLSALLWFLL